jgi:RNA polymerase sigma-70 factor, ECF subfamily
VLTRRHLTDFVRLSVRSPIQGTSLPGAMMDPLEQITGIVRRERGALVAIARSEGLGPEDAVEAVQDALCTFLSLVEPPVEHASATLKTMVRNASRNARRRHHRSLPHEAIEPGHEPRASERDAESLLAHAEDVVRLRMCVAELCSVQRAVVMLRLLDEQSGEDVALTLGLTRANVDVLVHRARGALRTCMRASG